MKKRIADIVTEFSVTGLNEVQRALKKLAREVRESGAKSTTLDKNMTAAAVSAEKTAASVDGIGEAADRAADSTKDLGDNLDAARKAAAETAGAVGDVGQSAENAAASVSASSDSMDGLANSAGRASDRARDLQHDVEKVVDPVQDAAVAVDGIGDAAAVAGSKIDDVAVSADRAADGLKDAKTEATALADAGAKAAASIAPADAGELASYVKRIKRAQKDIADLELKLPDADDATRSSLTTGIEASKRQIADLEKRLRDGTSERNEVAAAKAAAQEELRLQRETEKAAKAAAAAEKKRLRDIAFAREKLRKEREAAARLETDGERKATERTRRTIADIDRDLAALDAKAGQTGASVKEVLDQPRASETAAAVRDLDQAHQSAATSAANHATEVGKVRQETDALGRNVNVGGGVTSGIREVASDAKKAAAGIGEAERAGGRLGKALKGAGQDAGDVAKSAGKIGGVFGSLGRALSLVARGFAGIARAGTSALRSIGSSAAGVARGIVSAFASVGKAITGALTSKAGLITAGGLGLGNLAVRAAKGFGPLLGLAGGAAGALAGIVTMQDVMLVRQLSDALNLSPEVVGQWQFMANAVGATTEDVAGALQAVSTAMTTLAAGGDEAKPIAELFKKVGIEISNADGSFKSVSAMMAEIAKVSRSLTGEQRSYFFRELFGEADALKLSTLFRTIGEDYDRLSAKFEKNKSRGLFIDPAQMKTLVEFQARWGELVYTLKVLARELFLAMEPIFSTFIKFSTLKLEMPEDRAAFIQKVFVQPFERALALTNDIMKAWFNFDFPEWLTGESSGPVASENMWLFTVKKAASDVWDVLVGLKDLAYGAVEAFVSLFRAVDAVGLALTGFSMETWFTGSFAGDFRAFAADARKTLASLFDAPIDSSQMSTSLGQAVNTAVNGLKGVITPIWRAVTADLIAGWAEFQAALADDRPLAAMQTWTGTILKIVTDLLADLRDLGSAVWDVFVEGMPAPEKFKWLDDVKIIFESLSSTIGAVAEALRLLAPAYDALDGVSEALLGISGATALLLGGGLVKLGTAFAGLATSLGLGGAAAGLGALLLSIGGPLLTVAAAVGAIVGGFTLLYNLLTDFTGTVQTLIGVLKTAGGGIQAVASYAGNKLFGYGADDQAKVPGPNSLDYYAAWEKMAVEQQGLKDKLELEVDPEVKASLERAIAALDANMSKLDEQKAAYESRINAGQYGEMTLDQARADGSSRQAVLDQLAARTQLTDALAATRSQDASVQATTAEVEAAQSNTSAQTATVNSGQAVIDAANVQINANLHPISVNLGTQTVQLLAAPSQADALLRAEANRIGAR